MVFRSHLQTIYRFWHRRCKPIFLGLVGLSTALLITAIGTPGMAQMSALRVADSSPPSPVTIASPVATQIDQGRELYELGQLQEAIQVLQAAIRAAESQGQINLEVLALRNLALVYQELGQLENSQEAIATAFQRLQTLESETAFPLTARLLDIQGRVQLIQGNTEAAVTSWEQASTLYQQLGDTTRLIRSRINQAQALQRLGYYRRAIALLTPLQEDLQNQPDSLEKAVGLRTLGDALQIVGDLTQSEESLNDSLMVAEQIQSPIALYAARLSLGYTYQLQGDIPKATNFYNQAAASDVLPLPQQEARLRLLSLLIDQSEFAQAQTLWPEIQSQLASLPPSRDLLFARINLAQSMLRLSAATEQPSSTQIAQWLATTVQLSQAFGDRRAESFATGLLGQVYERSGRWADAQSLTTTALQIAQDSNAGEIAYRWHWQLGRILKASAGNNLTVTEASGKYEQAIASYIQAIQQLRSLRTDLANVNPVVQFSFQDNIEPIYRELVSLLLDPSRETVPDEDLEQARDVIESLQLAELDNFLREACLNANPVLIDQLDQRAAVIYPIILSDRLEVILSLPEGGLRRYTSPASQEQIEDLVDSLRQTLVIRVGRQYLTGMQQLYDWIIRPAEMDLEISNVETLVFVLDGALRNVPMAAMHNGDHFLVEDYGIALTPGLQLVDPQPIQQQELSVLTAGLSEARQGFSALPNVIPEVQQIQQEISAELLLNQDFTTNAIQQLVQDSADPIVHMATHGKFSSQKDETFILTWDGQLNINQLNSLLQASELNREAPIELLVLSACQTATGDKQAALGLAGVAVRAGARSTVATLWQVNDEGTAIFMSRFYEELTDQNVSKAEALRRAQLAILEDPQFRQHPYFWAPYVLIGNWL